MYKSKLEIRMNKNSIKYEYVHHAINTVFISILYFVYIFISNKFNWEDWVTYTVTLIVLIIIGFGFISPIIKYKLTSFDIKDTYIEIQRGWYFQKRTVQPINRVQFVTVKHGPISRLFNIYFVIIVTAGDMIEMPMLSRKQADKCRINIMSKVKEVVEDV